MIKGLITLLLGAKDNGFDRVLTKANKKLTMTEKISMRASKALGAFGGAMAIGAIVTDATRRIVSFDKSVVNLSAILRKSRAEIADLEQQAIDLGGTTIFTANQVADLQTILARFGFDQAEIKAATKGMLDLAAAADIQLSTAVDVAASTLRMFNLEASESSRVADVLTNAFTNSALTVDELAQAMVYVGPVANAVGAEIEEVAALLAILADNGVRGSIAGTSLRRIFTNLSQEGMTVADMFKLSAEGAEAFGDKLTFAKDQAGQYALSSLLILQENADIIEKTTDEMGELNSSQEVAAQQLTSLANKWVLVQSAWEGFILSIEKGNGPLGELAANILDMTAGLLTFMKTVQSAEINEGGFTPLVNVAKGLMEPLDAVKDRIADINKGIEWITKRKADLDDVWLTLKRIYGFEPTPGQLAETQRFIDKVINAPGAVEIEFLDPEVIAPVNELTEEQLALQAKWQKQQDELLGQYRETYVIFDKITGLYAEVEKIVKRMPPVTPFTVVSQRVGIGGPQKPPTNLGNIQEMENGMFQFDGLEGMRTAIEEVGTFNETLSEQEILLAKLAQGWAELEEALISTAENGLAQGAESFREYANQMRQTLVEMIGMWINTAVASMVTSAIIDSSLKGMPWLAPIAGALAAGLAKTAMNSLVPQLAEGGIAYGETLAMVGEYSSAASNPEVIAPLSKLQSIMGNAGGNVEVTGQFVLHNKTLVAAVRRGEGNLRKYGGG